MSTVIPITLLSSSALTDSSTSIRGVITLSWPFSSSTKQCAFLLAEPDFRLRNKKGQVRVRFTGRSAEAVAKSKLGIGDEVVLDLKGAKWSEAAEDVVATPGKSVDGELVFSSLLHLRTSGETGEREVNADLHAENGHTDEYDVASDSVPISRNADFRRRLEGGSDLAGVVPIYSSPAFVRRLRFSGEGLVDPSRDAFADMDLDQGEESQPRKKRKIFWRYMERSPSPTKEKDGFVTKLDIDPTLGMDDASIASQAEQSDKIHSAGTNPASVDNSSDSLRDAAKMNTLTKPMSSILTASTASIMGPPSLPRLQTQPTLDGIPVQQQVLSPSIEQSGPSTPELQPVSSSTLPLPSPFPAGSSPSQSKQYGKQSLSSVSQDAPAQQESSASQVVTTDSARANHVATQTLADQHSSWTVFELDKRGGPADAHSPTASQSSGIAQPSSHMNNFAYEEENTAIPVEEITRHDEDSASELGYVMYEDEAEEVIDLDGLGPMPSDDDDDRDDNESDSDGRDSIVDDEIPDGNNETIGIDEADHIDPRGSITAALPTSQEQDHHLSATGLAEPSVSGAQQAQVNMVEPFAMPGLTSGLFGFDGAVPISPSAVRPKEDLGKEKIMKKTFQSLFGFEGSQSPERPRYESADAILSADVSLTLPSLNETTTPHLTSFEMQSHKENVGPTLVEEPPDQDVQPILQKGIDIDMEHEHHDTVAGTPAQPITTTASDGLLIEDDSQPASTVFEEEMAEPTLSPTLPSPARVVELIELGSSSEDDDLEVGDTELDDTSDRELVTPIDAQLGTLKPDNAAVLSNSMLDSSQPSGESVRGSGALADALQHQRQQIDPTAEIEKLPSPMNASEGPGIMPTVSAAPMSEQNDRAFDFEKENSDAPDNALVDLEATSPTRNPANQDFDELFMITGADPSLQKTSNLDDERSEQDADREPGPESLSEARLVPTSHFTEEVSSQGIEVEDFGGRKAADEDIREVTQQLEQPTEGNGQGHSIVAPHPQLLPSPVASQSQSGNELQAERDVTLPPTPKLTQGSSFTSNSDRAGDSTAVPTGRDTATYDGTKGAQLPVEEQPHNNKSTSVDVTSSYETDQVPLHGSPTSKKPPSPVTTSQVRRSTRKTHTPARLLDEEKDAQENITVASPSPQKKTHSRRASKHEMINMPSATVQAEERQTEPKPASAKKSRSEKKSITSRLSTVPEALSTWFSPRRSTRLHPQETEEDASELDASVVDEKAGTAERVTSTGVATAHSYYTPLSSLQEKLNLPSQSYMDNAVDLIVVVKDETSKPQRAKTGPKDYFTILGVTDPSMQDGSITKVEIYRPWHAQLPVALGGDAILLRGFAVKSRKRQPYLLSTDSSAWCVWRYNTGEESQDGEHSKKARPGRRRAGSHHGAKEEIKGPPVELGEDERERAAQLHKWWQEKQDESV